MLNDAYAYGMNSICAMPCRSMYNLNGFSLSRTGQIPQQQQSSIPIILPRPRTVLAVLDHLRRMLAVLLHPLQSRLDPTLCIQQASLLDQLVKQALPLDQFSRRIELGDFSGLEDDDAVRVENGVDAMGDGDDGAVLEGGSSKRGLQERVGLDVDCRGSFVKDKDVGWR